MNTRLILILVLPLLSACQPPGQSAPEPEPPAVAPADQPMERVQAEVGVGAQGRSLDQEEGVMTRAVVEPAKSLFATRERVVFEIQIPQAMQLYQASEGRMPQSHEEFMEKIIAANNIRLPELPAGHTYIYDPERAELMVERPAQ